MSIGTWQNWAATQACLADLKQPTSKAELVADLRLAVQRGNVRVAGSSGSWSPLVPTTGTILDMRRLNRVLSLDLGDNPSVTVEGGITIADLTEVLAQHGYTLRCPTLFHQPTVAGAMATGSHGSGRFWAPFSDHVLAVELIAADGSSHILDGTDPDALRAVQVSLGLLGVVYSVTLAIEKELNVEVIVRELPREHTLDNLDDLLSSHEFVFLCGLPFQPRIWARLCNRTQAPLDLPTLSERIRMTTSSGLATLAGSYVLPWLSRHAAETLPAIIDLGRPLVMEPFSGVLPTSKALHHHSTYPPAWTMSFSLPRSQAAVAWRTADDLVRSARARGRYPVNLGMVGRCVGASQAFLSPAFGRESFFFEVSTATGTPDCDDFYRDLWVEILQIPGSRPHWAKRWEHVEPIARMYPELPRFKAQRARFDPGRVFLNDWLSELGF